MNSYKILKMPSADGSQHCHHFCPKCYYLFVFPEIRGASFCPNCGSPLQWDSDIYKIRFQEWVEYSKNYYEEEKVIWEDYKKLKS